MRQLLIVMIVLLTGLVSHRLAVAGDSPGAAPDGVAAAPRFAFKEQSDRLIITRAGQPAADFVFRDDRIWRPYFARVCAPGGLPVTRSHPPVAGVDAVDHDTMHPGIWLAFGDINGSDFWRNRGRIEQVRFTTAPAATADRLTFATESRLTTPDGGALCGLNSRFTLTDRPGAWRLEWEATFRSDDRDIVFGDQEEMGFGARVATPLTEKNGGVITNSAGVTTAAATWGQPAAWCDYSGVSGGQLCGMTLLSGPGNFRNSWWHNRDYGVFVANPFGRAALRQGAPSQVTVPRGTSFRLTFAALLHSGFECDPAAEYQDWVKEKK